MLKSIRAAAFVMALCIGATGSAGEGAKNGGIKIDTGGTRVDVNPDGNVSVRVPTGSKVEVDDDTPSVAAGEATENDGQISLMGTEQKQTVTCAKGAEVSIEGTSNDYIIKGECKHVSVTGTDNKVRVESVGRVTVEGTGNVVIWERGLGSARKPKISTSGVNNKVTQAR
jgi:hypothetical protein